MFPGYCRPKLTHWGKKGQMFTYWAKVINKGVISLSKWSFVSLRILRILTWKTTETTKIPGFCSFHGFCGFHRFYSFHGFCIFADFAVFVDFAVFAVSADFADFVVSVVFQVKILRKPWKPLISRISESQGLGLWSSKVFQTKDQ